MIFERIWQNSAAYSKARLDQQTPHGFRQLWSKYLPTYLAQKPKLRSPLHWRTMTTLLTKPRNPSPRFPRQRRKRNKRHQLFRRGRNLFQFTRLLGIKATSLCPCTSQSTWKVSKLPGPQWTASLALTGLI